MIERLAETLEFKSSGAGSVDNLHGCDWNSNLLRTIHIDDAVIDTVCSHEALKFGSKVLLN